MHLNVFIVDDELQTQATLKTLLLEFCHGVTVAGMTGDINEALEQLATQPIDVLFLDINLGNGNTGFDLLDQLGAYDCDVVFVTAYDSYALKAFNYAAVHYLLKPVNRVMLRDTIARIRKRRATVTPKIVPPQPETQQGVPRIALSDKDKTEFVPLTDIVYLESSGSYTIFCLKDRRRFIRSKNLKHFEEALMQYGHFIRIHKSYIVNREQIKAYRKSSQELEFLNDDVLPVSIGYRTFLEQLGDRFIP